MCYKTKDSLLEQHKEITPSSEANLDSVLQTSDLVHWQYRKINMSMLEKLDEVLPANGDWTKYIERMDQFLISNKTGELQKKPSYWVPVE